MRCKTPVICSDIPVFREIASEEVIFAKNDKDLIEKMNLIASSPNTRGKYSALGHKRSLDFSWQKTAKETSKIYKWVLKTKKSSIIK